MTQQVTAIRFYGRREREKLEAHLRACVTRWTEQWWVNDAGPVDLQWAEMESKPLSGSESWLGARYADDVEVHVGWADTTIDWLAELCVGHRGHGGKSQTVSLGTETLERVLSALCQEIAAMAVRDTHSLEAKLNRSAPPAAALRKNSGYVWVRVSANGKECFQLGVTLGLAKRIAASTEQRNGRPKLSSPREAIGAEYVHLNALLGEAVVALSELQRLSCGDVIRLDRRLGDSIDMQLGDGQPLGTGHLGASGNYRAIQMIVE